MTIVAAIGRNDKSESIIKEGKELADAFQEELHVLHVLTESEFKDLEMSVVEKSGQPGGQENAEKLAADLVNEMAEDLIDDFTPVGLVGKVPHEIIQYADQQNAQYLVIGGRQRTPVGKAVFGSDTQTILLNATQTVVTVMTD
ncbi:universal stress protein [halophilic archaeon]|nr:universal stress protein [halophilic archaeon]